MPQNNQKNKFEQVEDTLKTIYTFKRKFQYAMCVMLAHIALTRNKK